MTMQTVRSDADERTPVNTTHHTQEARLSPLTRAALDLGLPFDDVYEYAQAAQRAGARSIDLPEELERAAAEMRLHVRLDIALAESQHHMADARVHASSTLPASKLWWHACLERA